MKEKVRFKGDTHPLTTLIEILTQRGESKRHLAVTIGVRAQTLYGWERDALAKPHTFLLPATRALQIAKYFGVNPGFLRPDLWTSDSVVRTRVNSDTSTCRHSAPCHCARPRFIILTPEQVWSYWREEGAMPPFKKPTGVTIWGPRQE